MKEDLKWEAKKPFQLLLQLWAQPVSCFYNEEWWSTATFYLQTAVWNEKGDAREIFSETNAKKKFDHDSDHQITFLFVRKTDLYALSSKGFIYRWNKSTWESYASVPFVKVDGHILGQAIAYNPEKDIILAYGGMNWGKKRSRVKDAYLYNFSSETWQKHSDKNLFKQDYEWMKANVREGDIHFKMIYDTIKRNFLVVGRKESARFNEGKWETIEHDALQDNSARLVVHDSARGKSLFLDFRFYDSEDNKSYFRAYSITHTTKLIGKFDLPPEGDNITDGRHFCFDSKNLLLHFNEKTIHSVFNLKPLFDIA